MPVCYADGTEIDFSNDVVGVFDGETMIRYGYICSYIQRGSSNAVSITKDGYKDKYRPTRYYPIKRVRKLTDEELMLIKLSE